MSASLAFLAGVVIGASAARAEAPQIEIEPSSVPAARHEALLNASRDSWRALEKLLGVTPSTAPVKLQITLAEPATLSDTGRLAGRTRGLKIELSNRLSARDSQTVLGHELAHAFLAAACPASVPSEFFAESFALWASQDDQRLIASTLAVARKFHLAVSARDYLQERLSQRSSALSFHDPEPAQALARLIAESRRLRPTGDESLQRAFARAVSECRFEDNPLALALMGAQLQAPLSQETVFIIDGLSGETLLERGGVDRQHPVASLLKPFLLMMRPGARLSLLSKQSAEWNCPVARNGELWSWQRALVASCNGFFLDLAAPPNEFWKSWIAPLRLLGISTPPDGEMTMARAIGLIPGVEASARQLAALFRLLAIKDDAVAGALLETPRSGTLARLPDSAWFAKNAIAMKSGTIRNQQSEPEHGWIVAIGPRSSEGFPSFVAAIHQRGSSPQILLGRLRSHLEETLGARPLPPQPSRVQILSLVPRAAVRARCDGPWLHWRGLRGTPALEPPETIEVLQMKTLEARQCANGPIKISFPRQKGFEERDYWGRLVIAAPPEKSSSSSVTARQLRARTGSEILIETSEAHYLTGVLASEFPNGRAETLKALALVAKYNAAHSRHGGRPVCDTTHCQVFGPRNGDAEARPGARLSMIVRELGRSRIGGSRENWLPFSLGGEESWARDLASAEIEAKLQLPQTLYDVTLEEQKVVLSLGESGQGLKREIPCEKFRNTLRLPSCPMEVVKSEAGWRLSGEGEGHGEGLDLKRADRLAAEGRTHAEILRAFFPGIKVEN